MELPCKPVNKITDGVHTGHIKEVSFRSEPYEYTDLLLVLADESTCKAGYPSIVMEESKLGRLLMRMGVPIKVGQNYDPEKLLVGRQVTFQTTTEAKGDKSFTKVLTESVAPAIPPKADDGIAVA